MTPSDETLAVLLALPLEARRKLTECEGPGWYVLRPGNYSKRPHVLDVTRRFIWGPITESTAWLPASEGEILRVWGSVTWPKDPGYSIDQDEAWAATGKDGQPHDGTYDSRLRAALRCCPFKETP